jgi:hypothetical protein
MALKNLRMTPDSLSQMLSDFLDGSRAVVVVEDGAVVFDLGSQNIRFPASTTSACCICGRASATLCGAFWMRR